MLVQQAVRCLDNGHSSPELKRRSGEEAKSLQGKLNQPCCSQSNLGCPWHLHLPTLVSAGIGIKANTTAADVSEVKLIFIVNMKGVP